MKNIIRQSIIAVTLLLTTVTANAKGTSLQYSRTLNAQIGITATNQIAIGGIYKVVDVNGKVVLQGRIKSADTFYIPTGKLANGSYIFTVDGFPLQSFCVNN